MKEFRNSLVICCCGLMTYSLGVEAESDETFCEVVTLSSQKNHERTYSEIAEDVARLSGSVLELIGDVQGALAQKMKCIIKELTYECERTTKTSRVVLKKNEKKMRRLKAALAQLLTTLEE